MAFSCLPRLCRRQAELALVVPIGLAAILSDVYQRLLQWPNNDAPRRVA